MDRHDEIEGALAHLTRTVDELNEVVAAQAQEIDRLKAQVGALIERAREADAGGGVVLGDERPPHY